MEKYNIVIPIAVKDVNILLNHLHQIMENLTYNKIVIIGSSEVEDILNGSLNRSDINFIHEDNIVEGMSFNVIKDLIASKNEKAIRRSGWYFQQFIKLGYSYVSENDEYLVWDSDTLPLNKIEFYNTHTGQPYFDIRNGFNKPYFDTLENLFFEDHIIKKISESFITEYMLFKKNIVIQLIKEIEKNPNLTGATFYEKIISSIDYKALPLSGFSEYETYGNYTLTRFSDIYCLRKLKSLRRGKIYFGNNPTQEQLNWARLSYDTISFEHFEKKWSIISFIWNNNFTRKYISLSKIHFFLKPIINTYHLIRRIIKNILKR